MCPPVCLPLPTALLRSTQPAASAPLSDSSTPSHTKMRSLHKERWCQSKLRRDSFAGVTLPPDRFNDTDAELCRFAAAHGLTKVRKGTKSEGSGIREEGGGSSRWVKGEHEKEQQIEELALEQLSSCAGGRGRGEAARSRKGPRRWPTCSTGGRASPL